MQCSNLLLALASWDSWPRPLTNSSILHWKSHNWQRLESQECTNEYVWPSRNVSSREFIGQCCYKKRMVTWGAGGSVVGWGAMIQTGRLRVRVPWGYWIFDTHNPYGRTMVLGSTHPPTEMSTRYLYGGKERPARRADNFPVICEPIV
jgi:hypothetical protein